MGLGRALSESLWTVGTTIWKREAAWQGPVSTVTQKEREKETHYPPFSAGDVQVRTAASQVQLWPLEDLAYCHNNGSSWRSRGKRPSSIRLHLVPALALGITGKYQGSRNDQ